MVGTESIYLFACLFGTLLGCAMVLGFVVGMKK